MQISDGTSQQQRLSPALADGYFYVDEMDFEDLLSLGKDLASNLQFHDLDNRPQGTYESLFMNDETVIMAMILSKNLVRLQREFERLWERNLADLPLFVAREYATIDSWYRTLLLAEHPVAVDLQLSLGKVIEKRLVHPLHQVADIVVQWESPDHDGRIPHFQNFDSLWEITEDCRGVQFPRSQVPLFEDLEYQKTVLRQSFNELAHAYSYLQASTPTILNTALARDSHDPALALYMVFANLFRHVQHKLNRFTERHLDFYCKELLQLSPKPVQPDSAFLILEADPSLRNGVWIEKGTRFTYGKDEAGQEILYQADHDLQVTNAKVELLYSLYLERNPLVSPEREMNYVTQILADTLKSPELKPTGEAKPLFGGKTSISPTTVSPIDLGFAIASPMLYVQEGKRTLGLTIELTEPEKNVTTEMAKQSRLARLLQTQDKTEMLTALGELFIRCVLNPDPFITESEAALVRTKVRSMSEEADAALLDEILEYVQPIEVSQRSREQAFHDFIHDGFVLQVTGLSGWQNLEDYTLLPSHNPLLQAPYSMALTIHLSPDFEAIVPFNPELHEGNWDSALPVLQICINPQAKVFPYSMFQGLAIQSIDIQTFVVGLKNIQAYNQHGRLDPATPFPPFGPTPSVKSYVILGSYEMALKPVSGVTIDLNWVDYPLVPGGFREYYEDYPGDYDNSTFRVTAQTLNQDNWMGVSDYPGISLFQSAANSEALSSKNSLQVDFKELFQSIEPSVQEEDYAFDLKSRGGFFKLTLSLPETAFGHGVYPNLLTQQMMENAGQQVPTADGKPSYTNMPNPPYTPGWERISLDYNARQTIRLDKELVLGQATPLPLAYQPGIFHIHPFGLERLKSSGRSTHHTLLPHYDNDGSLFIGIGSKTPIHELSLFFHLAEDSTQGASSQPTDIVWSYMTASGWKPLGTSMVLADTTSGFLTSGSVLLNIPDDWTMGNPIMPNSSYWLRVAANQELPAFSSLFSVSPHALRVSHCPDAIPLDYNKHPTPQEVSWEPQISIPGLAGIEQKKRFFGGRPPENDSQLKIRMPERLAHKGRATTAWDYERLVLEQFPQIDKVKCFPNTRLWGIPGESPGNVLLTVLRGIPNCKHSLCSDTMVRAIELREVRDFIQSVSSPFVQVNVCNPTYDMIQVCCKVQFSGKQTKGFLITQLNQEISDYLCPWTQHGLYGDLGWNLRQADLESHIHSLDYVDFVTEFSLLQLTQTEDGGFQLIDTADPFRPGAENPGMIQPSRPWSLPMPSRGHSIQTVKNSQNRRFRSAEMTGITGLEIGKTFIIKRSGT